MREEHELMAVARELQGIRESCNDIMNYVDMSDSTSFQRESGLPFRGFKFDWQMAYGQALQRPSSTACVYLNEQQLNMIRAGSRAFCSLNPYWMSVRENRIAYAVGGGHPWTVVTRRADKKVEDSLRDNVTDELEKFCKLNKYRQRQGEKITRLDRDGEYFLRYFDHKPDGILRVRFVEPILVSTPGNMGMEGNVWFGISFDGTDYEEAVRYYIKPTGYDGQMTDMQRKAWVRGVPAEMIQHRKANVDLGSPRGIPATYSLREPCEQALSTLKTMGKLVDIRGRIALIVKQVNGTLGQIQPLLNRNRIGQVDSNGRTLNVFGYPPGSIIGTNDQRTYEMPSQHIDTDKIVYSLKSDLQSVAAAIGLADFTISGDSAAAFANALVKEGPMDRAISRLQQDLIDDDVEVYERALTVAASAGRLPKDVLEQVKVSVMPPSVIARDRIQNTQADEILNRSGAMSRRTMAMRANLDFDAEDRQLKAEGPSPQMQAQLDAKAAAGAGDTRSHQAPKSGKTTARGVPGGREPGPGANPQKAEEGVLEGSCEPHGKEKPTQAELDMAAVFLTPEWLERVKSDISALPATEKPPRHQVANGEGFSLGQVDGKQVWAVDAAALSVTHDAPGFSVAGNCSRWDWVPIGTILVDWNQHPADLAHHIFHDIVETRLMELAHWPYALAHKLAHYYERQYLRSIRPELASLA